jgi:hypothetical protein
MNKIMLSIPTIYLLIYWLGAFFIVYHLLKYGITSWPKKIVSVFLAGSIVLSILSFMLFVQIDFKQMLGDTFLQDSRGILDTFKPKTQ